MKKWEEQNQKRLHQKRVQEAKSTVSTKPVAKSSHEIKSPASAFKSHISSQYGNLHTTQPSNFPDTPQGSHISQISDYFGFEKQDLAQIPLYRLLKHYSLQQYAKALISRGFGYDLSKLTKLSRDELDKLIIDIKMMPGHKVKFTKLVTQVTEICFELMEHDELKHLQQEVFSRATSAELAKPKTSNASRSHSGPKSEPKKQIEKKNSISPGIRLPSIQKPNVPSGIKKPTKIIPKVPPVGKNERQGRARKIEKIGFDFFADSHEGEDEFSKALENILDKYQDDAKKKGLEPLPFMAKSKKQKEKNPLQIRTSHVEAVKTKNNPKGTLTNIDPKKSNNFEELLESGYYDSVAPFADEKLESHLSYPEELIECDNSKPNIYIQDNTKAQPAQPAQQQEKKKEPQEENAGIGDLIQKKLGSKNLDNEEINFELKKVKDMYSSFDGAKMTSTIANLDIEEMSHCLACAIEKHVEYFVLNVYPTKIFPLPPLEQPPEHPKVDPEISNLRFTQRYIPIPNEHEQIEQIEGMDEIDERFSPENMEPDQERISGRRTRRTESQDEVVFSGTDRVRQNPEEEKKEKENEVDNRDKEDKIQQDSELNAMSSLGIISEKSHETSRITEKMRRTVQDKPQQILEEASLKEEEEDNEKIEGFLRESLKESLLFNIEKEKQEQEEKEKEALAQSVGSLKGFTTQIYPNQSGQYIAEGMDLREQVMCGGENIPNNREVKVEVLFNRERDMNDFSMADSLFTELEMDYANMDVVRRIRSIFEKVYDEKNLIPENYNKKISGFVDKSSVANYCKNIVITTKMEKEVFIICLVYIERLIVRTNMHLNGVNWKRITFTALVLASKIWDDESFENASFAKAFPQYTTKEINELERVFLEFLDYDLMINGSDYAKYYFVLRCFAEKNKKSFPLKALNVQTVRQLQKKAATTSKTLRETYAEPMNKSFS